MGRIEFDGEGAPIPALALPPFGSESDLPPTTLTFTNNVDFSVSDYRTLGFTHYEVWCVGAVGGRGGDGTDEAILWSERTSRSVPQSVWNLHREANTYDDWAFQRLMYEYYRWWYYHPTHPDPSFWWAADATPAVLNKVYPYPTTRDSEIRRYLILDYNLPGGWPGGSWSGTRVQAVEYANPNHIMSFTTWKEAILSPKIQGMGGGGGGGGFHKTSGMLADLPDLVSIVVGKAGADAGYAQTKQLGSWTPEIPEQDKYYYSGDNHGAPPPYPYDVRDQEISDFFEDYLNTYPAPKTIFANNPVKGQDGGFSSFADDICQASGGEGGGPGMVWDGAKFIVQGYGGEGGIGGRIEAGGGAAGSVAEGVNGSDGIWIPETGIGSGGGGGKGGRPSTGGGYTPGGAPVPLVQHLATAGGQGSYSFADTTVYGQRQFRQPWTYMKPVWSGNDYNFSGDPIGGSFSYVPTVESNSLVTPGSGGGARPFPNLKYGGRGVGYSPDGVVVLRLTKIT